MARLSKSRREFLVAAMRKYHEALPGSAAEEYLAGRGLAGPEVAPYRLGYVADPLPGHDLYRGMLAIPYIRWSPQSGASVVNMRFRCLAEGCEHDGHGKYMSEPGSEIALYNTISIIKNDDEIAVVEGELDTISAELSGMPAVGVPGAQAWKPYFAKALVGYETVWITADGDAAGRKFAESVAKTLHNARIVHCDPGEDVNSEYVKYGPSKLLERIGR